MVKISFNKEQIKYLNKLMNDRKQEFLDEVNNDSFEADEKSFKKLGDKLFNLDNLSKSNAKVGKKSSKKPRKKTGYMKWLWDVAMPSLKKEKKDLSQTEYFKLAGKKWSQMTDNDKKKYD
uniref:HMG box domain-containing protein n=1 Tax=Mimiviridae sp. ChoanoV1 TaxID=2596887 RepID=A0A5B8IIH8_9VIRU|nr:hypothetical protein 4_12 [Mimiviridae sp. ChoanoV1]